MADSFAARSTLRVGGGELRDLPPRRAAGALRRRAAAVHAAHPARERPPRHGERRRTSRPSRRGIATGEPSREISFTPARVLLQDFTGVPAIVDLAAMRDAMRDLGGDPAQINPLLPAELVIDHSVQVDEFATRRAIRRNAELEFERNRERYAFLRWGQRAFDDLKVVPPNTGIVHQVNLEYLAASSSRATGQAFPDTLVGTDSHTTMINGLGVLGWGVGGIEAEAAMLGEAISMLVPQVVGFRLTGELREGATATDLVLTVTEILRQTGVVGKFVEYFGHGLDGLPLADRATIGNMSPEYGATCGFFPVDEQTLELPAPDRPQRRADRARRGVLQGEPALARPEPRSRRTRRSSSSTSATSSRASPGRAARRTACRSARRRVVPRRARRASASSTGNGRTTRRSRRRSRRAIRPPSRRPGATTEPAPRRPPVAVAQPQRHARSGQRRRLLELEHGSVVIAAITSCTNTSNPQVMVGAGPAGEEGRRARPDAQAVGEVEPRARLEGRHRVLRAGRADGRTSRSSASTPSATAARPASATPARCRSRSPQAVAEGDLVVCAVLSGNRNFEARIHPEVKANYLASPPLVVAYALAGRMDIDLDDEPLGRTTTATTSSCATSGRRRRRSQETIAEAVAQRDVPSGRTPTSSPATSTGARCPCPRATFRLGAGLDVRAAGRRTSTGCSASRSRSRTSTARAASSWSATRSRPTTSRRPARSSPTRPAGRVPGRARRRAQGLQLVRLAPRQPRGDGARHVRERPPAQPARPRLARAPGRCTCRAARR